MVIVRKFPQLSRIDTGTIKEEKEKSTKKKLVDERLKRKAEKFTKSFGAAASKVSLGAKQRISAAQEKLQERREELEKPNIPKDIITKEDYDKKEEYVRKELEKAEDFAEEEQFEKAEKKYINLISDDPRNIDAYEGLGELYYDNKMYNEARETFSYILKLKPENALAHYNLAYVDKMQGKIQEAKVHFKKAVELEPRNPKYLSELVEIYIDLAEKIEAQLALQKLQEVNPENASIPKLQEEISELNV
jgi:tetratricopeptide (TPR) repeat protein